MFKNIYQWYIWITCFLYVFYILCIFFLTCYFLIQTSFILGQELNEEYESSIANPILKTCFRLLEDNIHVVSIKSIIYCFLNVYVCLFLLCTCIKKLNHSNFFDFLLFTPIHLWFIFYLNYLFCSFTLTMDTLIILYSK